MSKVIPQVVNCPECGNSIEVGAWHELNALLDPEGKEALLKGELNVFRCAECGYEGLLTIPLLYSDPDKGFLAQLIPWPLLKDEEFLSSLEDGGKVHLVFDYGELARYILFRDALEEKRRERGRVKKGYELE